MSKHERLTSLLEFLRNHSKEAHFNAIYRRLEAEYQAEQLADDSLRTNYYLNNLRQTMEKHAEEYISAKEKRPIKGAPDEFRSFINNFRRDIQQALGILDNS